MNTKNKFLKAAALLLVALLSTGLLFAKAKGPIVHEQKGTAVLIEHPERMFYEIVGTDKNGNTSRIYIQGTIHVADEKIYPVSDKVLDAFNSADHIYGELSSESWAELEAQLGKEVILSMMRAKKENKIVSEQLTEKELDNLKYYIGLVTEPEQVELLITTYDNFEPWVMSQVLTEVMSSQLPVSSSLAYDTYFKNLADEQEKVTLGLDPLKVQLDVITFGDYDIQLKILKDSLADKNGVKRQKKSMKEMYSAYVKGDKKKLTKFLFADIESEANDPEYYFMDDYIDALFRNRNKSWADQMKTFLEEGGTYFIYTGAGHYLGDFSVFTYLEELGVL